MPTTTPAETLGRVADFFRTHAERVAAVGIASFGPIDLDERSPTFGWVTTTPKPGWARANVVGAFRALSVPVAFDTDVNGAALGEHRWGAGHGVDPFVYVTVGTGIGGGVMRAVGLLERVRDEVEARLAGYVRAPELVAPALGERAGVLGGLALAQGALARGSVQ